MTTSIASFDAPTTPVTNKPTIPVTTPVTPSTLNVEEFKTLKEEETDVSNERKPVTPGTPVTPRQGSEP